MKLWTLLATVRAAHLAPWIHSLGGFVSAKLEVRVDGKGRALFANASIAKDEVLMSVPLEAMLLGEAAASLTPCASEIRDFFNVDRHPHNSRTQAIFSIMTFLLSISGNSVSREQWPHLHDLLQNWDDRHRKRFPLFWTSSMMKKISGTLAFDAYSIAIAGVEREFDEALRHACPHIHKLVTLLEYKQIWSLVNSRVLTYPGAGGVKPSQPALVPMFDVVNHALPAPSRALLTQAAIEQHLLQSLGRFGTTPPQDTQRPGLHLWLERSIHAGQEVTDVYGLQSNQEMLWTFGFTVPWIHNLTCLTRTRLTISLNELPSPIQHKEGASSSLEMLVHSPLHFELGGCSAEKTSLTKQLAGWVGP